MCPTLDVVHFFLKAACQSSAIIILCIMYSKSLFFISLSPTDVSVRLLLYIEKKKENTVLPLSQIVHGSKHSYKSWFILKRMKYLICEKRKIQICIRDISIRDASLLSVMYMNFSPYC